jgi:hypothetical protein
MKSYSRELMIIFTAACLFAILVNNSAVFSLGDTAQKIPKDMTALKVYCETNLEEAEKLVNKGMYEGGISIAERANYFVAAAEKFKTVIQYSPQHKKHIRNLLIFL